jgi:hypothetical protein
LKDVVFRIHPLTDADVREMVRSVKGIPCSRAGAARLRGTWPRSKNCSSGSRT